MARGLSRLCAAEEGAGFAKEEIELVVVDPVAGVGDLDEAAIGDGFEARIVFGVVHEAFRAPEEERGAADVAVQRDRVVEVLTVRGKKPGEVVELPDHGAVGVPIGAMEGEVFGDFVGQMRVGFLHARDGGGEVGVAVRCAAFDAAGFLDPVADTLRRGGVDAVVAREAEAFNGDKALDAFGVDAGVGGGDDAAKRVADNADGLAADDVDHRAHVEHVFGDGVERAGRPGAVAVAAEVEGIDVEIVAKGAGDPVPVAGVVESAVDEQERGFGVVAPVPELEFEAVGVEEVGYGFQNIIVKRAAAGRRSEMKSGRLEGWRTA